MAAILDATARILAAEGFEAVNTNRVAEEAGVSIGSLYQYFPNKAALVGAVAVRHSEAMARIIAHGVRDGAGDLRTLVRKLIRATVQAHAENPRLRQAILEELPRIGRPARIVELKRNILQAIVDLLSAHRDQLEVRDLQLAAFVVVNTVEHLTHLAQTVPDHTRNLGRLERELNKLVIGYLTGQAGT